MQLISVALHLSENCPEQELCHAEKCWCEGRHLIVTLRYLMKLVEMWQLHSEVLFLFERQHVVFHYKDMLTKSSATEFITNPRKWPNQVS
jgi:hypothetical protein